jgi:hypothetical protein
MDSPIPTFGDSGDGASEKNSVDFHSTEDSGVYQLGVVWRGI